MGDELPPHAHSYSFKRTFVIQLSHGRYEVSSSVIEEGAVVGEDAELPPLLYIIIVRGDHCVGDCERKYRCCCRYGLLCLLTGGILTLSQFYLIWIHTSVHTPPCSKSYKVRLRHIYW